jgi:osmotically-inducible protein OsmY
MDAASEYQQLRQLLLAREVSALADLERDLDLLQHQIHDPEKLLNLLAPIVASVIRRGEPALSLAIVHAITPLLDRALRDKVAEDASGVSRALAPSSTRAIAVHYASDPRAATLDLAPLMGAAIKEQIRGERDAMIDALYPVIGSTISKYLSETLGMLVRTINERIESRLSFKSLGRKIRSRFTGVSEAEFLLREALPPRLEAAFLIHKSSGLVIAQAQNRNVVSLDPDLLSGMLTAIRSLFNDSMNEGGAAKELDQIDYGESKIVLEVAGFCYLAAVIRGIPDEPFRRQLRTTLTTIVQEHGETIARYSGRDDEVPESVPRTVRDLVDHPDTEPESHRTRKPYAAMAAGALLLLLICVPLFLHLYRNHLDRETEAKITAALHSASPSPLRGIAASVDRGTVRLTGTTPNEYQRAKAGEIVQETSPGITIDNAIVDDGVSPFPILLWVRAKEIVTALNTISGIYIEASVENGDVVLTGFAADSSLIERITCAFDQLPGLHTFANRLKTGEMEIAGRLLFDMNSVTIRPTDRAVPAVVKSILDQTPWSRVLITGHSDDVGGGEVNRRIADGRAIAAETVLLNLGVPPDRILVEGRPGSPTGNAVTGADSLSRCVRFILLPTHSRGHE